MSAMCAENGVRDTCADSTGRRALTTIFKTASSEGDATKRQGQESVNFCELCACMCVCVCVCVCVNVHVLSKVVRDPLQQNKESINKQLKRSKPR
jgi:hypothetical protein